MHHGHERLLIFDDSDAELARTTTALQVVAPRLKISTVRTSVEALRLVRASRPDLILMDLVTLGQDGLDFLAILRADDDLSVTPVIVLSRHGAAQHLWTAYRARANAFIEKRDDLVELQGALQTVCDFWFRVNKLPVGPGGLLP